MLFDRATGSAAAHGPLDPRLGRSREDGNCGTCGLSLADCMGHFGHLPLAMPVFHAGFHRQVLALLNLICKRCARLLIDEALHRKLVRALRSLDAVKRRLVARSVVEACRKCRDMVCPRCGFANGAAKRVGKNTMAIYCERPKGTAAPVGRDERAVIESLNPVAVMELFRRIPDADCELLNMGRPENLVIRHVPVPPACMRPMIGVEHAGGTHEDDLTVLLLSMTRANGRLRSAVEKGESLDSLMSHWEVLQTAFAAFVDSSYCKEDKKSKQQRGLVQRLEGKHGRFRLNLSGKRVNFTGRSTISPDPNIEVNEVGVPELVAKKLTLRELVRAENLEQLRAAVVNGPHRHPGAVAVWRNGGDTCVSLHYGDNGIKAQRLTIGDVVERHVRNGDPVLFNRQPSLHRNSIMCHLVRVVPHRTFRLNECICTPYGADFDGDEMNLHVPQTLEAQTEAVLLMGVTQNMVTPKTGEPIVAAIQDFITASYLLTQKDCFFGKSEMCQVLACLIGGNRVPDLPLPAVLKPKKLWTGKQVFSVLLQQGCGSRPGAGSGLYLETKNKSFVAVAGVEAHMDAADNYVIVQNSELLCGRIDKKLVGTGSKQNLVHRLIREHGGQVAVAWLSNLSRLCARYIGSRGFSIGIEDVSPSLDLDRQKKELVEMGSKRCADSVVKHVAGELSAGELEQHVQMELSSVRERAGKACLETLLRDNSALIMANCGSKGSALNISQMVGLVGQQILAGARIEDGFTARALPHFEEGSRDAAARGFVRSSFFSGLSATEFFFHAMAGREGVIDTAVKTSETGYMQRRMIKSLEDLQARGDLSVRDATGNVVQFMYGNDGLDPSRMEVDIEVPMDLSLLMRHASSAVVGRSLSAEAVKEAIAHSAAAGNWSSVFAGSVVSFVLACKTLPSASVLGRFLESVRHKYERAKVEPGTAVGALCSQSVGEPATQMTLKTFHAAGIGANITMGVPRLTELINASANPKTPLVTAPLSAGTTSESVLSQIEPTRVRDICAVTERASATSYELLLTLNFESLRSRGLLHLTAEDVREAIGRARGLKVKPKEVWCAGKRQLVVSVHREGMKPVAKGADKTRESLTQRMMFLLERVPEVLVSGHAAVRRASVNEKQICIVEGGELAAVLRVAGVMQSRTSSNNVLEVARVLGIEAAKTLLEKELRFVMEQHHIELNTRHLGLLGDYMTWSGAVLGINRHGMAKTKHGVLVMASFEKTAESLFEAAIHNRLDPVTGVSEAVILGQPIPMGTGGDFSLSSTAPAFSASSSKVPFLHRMRFNSDLAQ